jgi:hypothetical protein
METTEELTPAAAPSIAKGNDYVAELGFLRLLALKRAFF